MLESHAVVYRHGEHRERTVSMRSYNRNFKGEAAKDAFIYLASPVSCAVFALREK
jgi:homoaconitase/3-isopropylmalate dehydratase large subunit